MPNPPTESPTQFIQGTPVLHVPDVQVTATFYRDILGFTWDYGDEDYCVVWRDNSAIHFVKGDTRPAGVHLFQWVKNADVVHDEVKAAGGTIAVEIADRPYGIRDFSVRDPNGVDVVFGQDIE